MSGEPVSQVVSIPVGGGRQVSAELTVPANPRAVVLFAHGSGSSRRSPRNKHIAKRLEEAGLATVLVDLLAPGEDRPGAGEVWLRSDVPYLAERLITVLRWVERHSQLGRLPIGLFGSHTGAAAALMAAALRPEGIAAVVCRGGRPELAGEALTDVLAPTLFVVGENDAPIVQQNREAQPRLSCPTRLEIVPGASHLFDEPGALDRVAELARVWFARNLAGEAQESAPTQPGA
ncbi:MAG: dienelactone hydrolase family protein [Deltaproteobacteria bacterium]|nr:dienelactone hydrolase family protein [Deltaproteobacteria bacterium]